MPVLNKAQTVLVAAAIAIALPSGTASAEQLTKEKFERAMQDVFSGKIFEAAAKQVRQAHKKYVVEPASRSATWPFFIPDRSQEPVRLVPQIKPQPAAIPKAKPVVASAKVRRTQTALNVMGYDAGPADGVYGRKTAKAVERYQSMIGETVTGALTPDQRTLLLRSAQQKRQLASVRPDYKQTPSRAHTVVSKQPGTIVEPQPNAAAKQGQVVILDQTTPPSKPVVDDKWTLPQTSDAERFDADDPDDVDLPTQ